MATKKQKKAKTAKKNANPFKKEKDLVTLQLAVAEWKAIVKKDKSRTNVKTLKMAKLALIEAEICANIDAYRVRLVPDRD